MQLPFIVFFLLSSYAWSQEVDIDVYGKTTSLELSSGVYTLTAASGALSYWANDSGCGSSCWAFCYSVYFSNTSRSVCGPRVSSPEKALKAAPKATIVVTQKENVSFRLIDSPYGDNRGKMTVLVERRNDGNFGQRQCH